LEGVVWLVKKLLLQSFWKLTGSKIKFLANLVPVSIDITTFITASWFDGRPDPCVEVSPQSENIILSYITVSPSTMSLVEGDYQTISSIIAHYSDDSTADIALDDCIYDSSNTGVATVDAGVITAITSGTATITVGYTESGITRTDTVEVTVQEEPAINGVCYQIQWSTAESNGWANPLGEGEELITSTAYDYNSDIYLNNWGKRHTGTDIISELDGNVYSIASGTIVKITKDYSSTSNQSVVIIKHTNSNNEDFFAIYGHVFARSDLEVNSELEAGEKIGIIKKAGSPVHLHFGINLSAEIVDFMFTNSDGVQWGWGRIPEFANPSDYGWIDPIDYLNTHSIENIILNSIIVSPSTMSLVEGDSRTISSITAHYSDDSTADIALDDCIYDSSNTGVATVDTGIITAVAPGTATITVSYTEAGITKFDTVAVTVNSIAPNTYTITASAGSNGSINPSGNVTVNQGSDKSFTIAPDTGYQIDNVLVDGSSVGAVSSYTFINVTEDHSISATFISEASGLVHNLTKDTYYDTIQAALDDAGNDNIIEVTDGTYDESITFPSGKVIILRSVNGADSTIIRGNPNSYSCTVVFNGSLTGTTLEGFTITHKSGKSGRGIHIKSSYLNIDNCTISGNSAFEGGGGIYNSGTLTITSSTISGNSTDGDGGGIYNVGDDGSITITSSTISGNSTGTWGGGISNSGTLTITGSTISNNSATYSGGGIDISYGSLTITASTISDNSADWDGGGIYKYNGTLTIGGVSPAEKNTICGNRKGANPSLDQQIRDSSSGDLYETCKDTNNISAYCGVTPETYTITASAGSNGSINPSGNITVNQGSDKSFTITPDTGYQIDNVLVDGSSVGAVSSYTFINVTEDHSISATFISEASGLVHNINKGTYYNTIQAALDDADNDNTIEVSDGTYDESITFPSTKKIILQSVNGASLTVIRGDNYSSTVNLSNSSEGTTLKGFNVTHADGLIGRGIYIAGGNLSIKNCNIADNNFSSYCRGSGIDNEGILTIDESIICGNTTYGSGGGIDNYNGTLTIITSTISGNSASSGGGIANGNGTLTIIRSTISDNTGGGIDNYNGTLTITASAISDNTGGGISNGTAGTLTIITSTISGNSASSGGGIANVGTLNINTSTISSNFASLLGGGIYNGGSLNITGSEIFENFAYYHGGGICNYHEGTLIITESTISGNTTDDADAGGGGFADIGGGGISNCGILTIVTSTISDNITDDTGGGIETFNDDTMNIIGSTISNNSANYGGGIDLYNSWGNIIIGGDSDSEKNTICGNYKSGYEPSLDQQIRDDSGDLYEIYKDTNYISVYCE
jgi:hypothetical protein